MQILPVRTNRHVSPVHSQTYSSNSKPKNRQTDRLIYSIDRKKFQWGSDKRTKKKLTIKSQSSEEKFADYLSDHLSDDSQSISDMLKKSKSSQKGVQKRVISQVPFKRSKIKQWKDNFYTNLLDWSPSGLIFAASSQKLYHSSLLNLQQQPLLQNSWLWIKGSNINAIRCNPLRKTIALAYQCGSLRIYDYQREKSINVSLIHSLRITAIDWNAGWILTGSKDRETMVLDDRTMKRALLLGKIHQQEVLGIRRCDNFIATGGNDNVVAIYDVRKSNNVLNHYQHDAAVKSLAWLESKKTLISGGGTSDKKIKIWSNSLSKVTNQIQTGSQICSLTVSKTSSQFVSCQGFSQNQIVLWDYQGKRIHTLHGQHSSRVLYSALSPNGQYLATGAGDMNLFVWKMFPQADRRGGLSKNGVVIR